MTEERKVIRQEVKGRGIARDQGIVERLEAGGRA